VESPLSNPTTRSQIPTGDRKLSNVSDVSGRGSITKAHRRSFGGTEPLRLSKTNPDVKAHLSHLGPSNLAARPKATRINTVKIKAVHPAAAKATHNRENPRSPIIKPESKASALSGEIDPFNAERARETQAIAVESTGLLGPGKTSSDAVQAVGYGTLSTSPTAKAKSPMELPRQVSEQPRPIAAKPSPLRQSAHILDESVDPLQKIPEVASDEHITPEETPDKAKAPSQSPSSSTPVGPLKMIVTPENTGDKSEDEAENPDENDSGATMKSGGTRHSASRLSIARSGSIFESERDVNGVRKLVLNVQEGHDEAENEDDLESQALLSPSTAEPSSKDKKKKKRKPKKKKAAHNP
jgi:metal transporter CNNM